MATAIGISVTNLLIVQPKALENDGSCCPQCFNQIFSAIQQADNKKPGMTLLFGFDLCFFPASSAFHSCLKYG